MEELIAMKVIMYGSRICPDCVWAEEKLLKRQNIELEYRQITKNVGLLKEFLAYRDNEKIFEAVKKGGYIGIPFFILEDGSMTLNLKDFVD